MDWGCQRWRDNFSLWVGDISNQLFKRYRLEFKKGQIYIFDEPLSGLDALTKERVIKMILTELHDKTIIVITHDSEILPKLNRIINLKDINNN